MRGRAIPLLLILFFAAASAEAQVIRGKVLIPSVSTPDRVEVLLEKTDGQVVVRSYSDPQGNFEMRGMPVGGYEIVVRVEGYLETRMRIEVLPPNQGATIVNIPIERRSYDIVAQPGDPVIDVAELNRNYSKKVLQEYEKAVEENRKGETDKSIERLENILKEAPDFYSAHTLLGIGYQKSKRYRDAEKEYRTAQQVNPRSAQPLLNLGSLFIQEAEDPSTRGQRARGRVLDDALDALDEAVKLDSQSAVAYYLLGVAYYRSAFFDDAETNLRRALNLDGHVGSTRLMLVNLYMRQEKWQAALDHLNTFLSENPKAPNKNDLEQTRAKIVERLKK